MHTDEQIARAAKLAEQFDPSNVPMDDTSDLRAVAEAVDGVRAGEARVRELVALARANGRSWGEIGIALGVSRQAARERFSEKAPRLTFARRTVTVTDDRAISCGSAAGLARPPPPPDAAARASAQRKTGAAPRAGRVLMRRAARKGDPRWPLVRLAVRCVG